MTLRSRIIPCLLIDDGGLVKTRRFAEPKYVGDPINAVKIFNEKEVDELSIYDIGATRRGTEPDFEHLRAIAAESRMPLCYGGGVTSADCAARLISSGFEKVSVSSAALQRPALIREIADAIGQQSVVVTVDIKKVGLLGRQSVVTHNGSRPLKVNLAEFLHQAEDLGAGEIVINNVDRDGMMTGYDLELARTARDAVSLPLTMLGGAGAPGHMRDLIAAIGICGAAVGSMFVFHGPYRAVLISYARP